MAVVVAGLCGANGIADGATQGQSSAVEDGEFERTVQRYCLGCHNDRTRTAGLSLSGIRGTDTAPDLEVLEKVFQKLRAGEMPPAGRPRPDGETIANLLSGLERTLDRQAEVRPCLLYTSPSPRDS